MGTFGEAEVLMVREHPVLRQALPSDNIAFPSAWEDRSWEAELTTQTKQVSHSAKHQACTILWYCQRQ